MQARRSGFTLIELLIVVIVVGILATITFTKFWSVRARAHVSAMQHDLRSLASQQEAYYNTGFAYASDLTALPDFVPSDGVLISINYAASDGWGATAAHAGAEGRQCGVFQPAAPDASGAPATQPGIIMCN